MPQFGGNPGEATTADEMLARRREAELLRRPYELPPGVVAPSEPPLRGGMQEMLAREHEAFMLRQPYNNPPNVVAPTEDPVIAEELNRELVRRQMLQRMQEVMNMRRLGGGRAAEVTE